MVFAEAEEGGVGSAREDGGKSSRSFAWAVEETWSSEVEELDGRSTLL